MSAALDSVKENMDLPWISRHNVKIAAPPEVFSKTPELEANMPEITPTSALKTTADESTLQSPLEDAYLEAEVESGASSLQKTDQPGRLRILQVRNFTQALKEITPSSSESLGSLTELKKWNDEFGEGRRDRKKRQVWGKGLFGFIDGPKDVPKLDLKPVRKE